MGIIWLILDHLIIRKENLSDVPVHDLFFFDDVFRLVSRHRCHKDRVYPFWKGCLLINNTSPHEHMARKDDVEPAGFLNLPAAASPWKLYEFFTSENLLCDKARCTYILKFWHFRHPKWKDVQNDSTRSTYFDDGTSIFESRWIILIEKQINDIFLWYFPPSFPKNAENTRTRSCDEIKRWN